MGETLHRLHRAQSLGRLARGIGDPILIFTGKPPQPPPQHNDRHHDHRHQQQHIARQLGRGQRQKRHPPDQRQHIAQSDRHGGPDHRQDQRGIRGDARHDLAGHDALKPGRAHAQHLVKDRAADIGHHALAQPGDEVIPHPGAQRQKRGNQQEGPEIGVQKRHVTGAKAVHHPAHRHGQDQTDGRGQEQRHRRQHHQRPIGPHERPQRRQRPHPFRLCPLFDCLGHACHPSCTPCIYSQGPSPASQVLQAWKAARPCRAPCRAPLFPAARACKVAPTGDAP